MRDRITSQRWHLSHRFDKRALPLADVHYNRRKVGSPQFAPPGSCLVLLTENADAVWITSWPKPEYVRHAWPGAWVNSLFRNQSPRRCLLCGAEYPFGTDKCLADGSTLAPVNLSSELIREAVAATCAFYGNPPKQGMVSFIDPDKTKRKRDPGRCYIKAGFTAVGHTAGELDTVQMAPGDMPMALAALPMIKPEPPLLALLNEKKGAA